MATVQMNVRIDPEVKKNVDAILHRNNTTASEFIQSMWEKIEAEQKLPDLTTEDCNDDFDYGFKNPGEPGYLESPSMLEALYQRLDIPYTSIADPDFDYDEFKERAFKERFEEEMGIA